MSMILRVILLLVLLPSTSLAVTTQTEAIREALPEFEKRIKGFSRLDAILTGVETRTSSPVRILRGKTGHSISTPGLYPAGEGSGYAGGILSSAMDGMKTAEAIIESISGQA